MAKGPGWVAAVLVAVLGWGLPRGAQAQGQVGSGALADDATLIALAVALSCSDALDVVPAPRAEPSASPAQGPELELVATVRAKVLRFDQVPKVDVVFRGKRRTVWKTERVNLPARPEPGVVYRDVQVRLTITTNFEELGAMLQEAKHASRGVRIEHEDAAVMPTSAPAQASAPAEPPAEPDKPAR